MKKEATCKKEWTLSAKKKTVSDGPTNLGLYLLDQKLYDDFSPCYKGCWEM